MFTHEHSFACFLCVLVKDLALQEHLSPQLTSFNQETPMKPSQVPNRLSLHPPRRALPLVSPELCPRDRLGPSRQPPHALGPICSKQYNPGSSTNVGTPTHRPHHMPRGRLGPPPHPAQHLGSFCSSQHVPGSQSHFDTTAKRPQPSTPGVHHHAPPHFMKDLNNHSRSSYVKGHQETEPMVVLSYSGNKNVTARSQELHKVLYLLSSRKYVFFKGVLFLTCTSLVMWCWTVVACTLVGSIQQCEESHAYCAAAQAPCDPITQHQCTTKSLPTSLLRVWALDSW